MGSWGILCSPFTFDDYILDSPDPQIDLSIAFTATVDLSEIPEEPPKMKRNSARIGSNDEKNMEKAGMKSHSVTTRARGDVLSLRQDGILELFR